MYRECIEKRKKEKSKDPKRLEKKGMINIGSRIRYRKGKKGNKESKCIGILRKKEKNRKGRVGDKIVISIERKKKRAEIERTKIGKMRGYGKKRERGKRKYILPIVEKMIERKRKRQ